MPIKYVPYSQIKRPFCTPRCKSNLHASISTISKPKKEATNMMANSHMRGPILGLEAPQIPTSYRRPSSIIREKRNKKLYSLKPYAKLPYSSVDYSAVMSEQIKKLIYISKKKEKGTIFKDNKTVVNIDIRFSFKPKYTSKHLTRTLDESPNRLIIRGTSPFKERKGIIPTMNRPHTTNGARSLRVII
jgi:hypothetical protein